MAAHAEHPEPELRKRRDSISDDDGDSEDSMDEKEMDKMVDEMNKEESNQQQTKWGKIKAYLKEWGETCSCHGVPHMAQAHTFFAAIVWLIILFFAACGFVYLFSSTLAAYLRFDKIVMLNLGMETSNFPSVTFCNINPYKLSKIRDVPELNALLTVYESAGK